MAKFNCNVISYTCYDFVANELLEFLCGMFPISDITEHTYIAG